MGTQGPTEQIEEIGANRVVLIDFDVRSQLATYNLVPAVRQERFEVGVRRDKSVIPVPELLHSLDTDRSTSAPLTLLKSITRALQNIRNHPKRTGGWLNIEERRSTQPLQSELTASYDHQSKDPSQKDTQYTLYEGIGVSLAQPGYCSCCRSPYPTSSH